MSACVASSRSECCSRVEENERLSTFSHVRGSSYHWLFTERSRDIISHARDMQHVLYVQDVYQSDTRLVRTRRVSV